MKRLLTPLALASVSLFLFTACDWESGGSSNSYNSRFDWANFSGVYRPVSGRYVVTDFSGGVPASEGGESQTVVRDESVGTTQSGIREYSGTVRNSNILPGSFSITLPGGRTYADDGSGSLNGSGTIVYSTGAWTLNLNFAPTPVGEVIRASYTYTVVTEDSPATDAGPGTSGFQLFQFTVAQSGQRLILTDNTGREYTGDIGSIRGTRGDSRDTPFDVADPQTGDTVIATFNVEGISPANVKVKITGTLQAIVAANGVLTNRSMQGTWIENNGRTGSVNAQAAPIRITMPNTPGGEG